MCRLVAVCAVIVCLVVAAACGSDNSSERANILIVVTDDQRYDTMGEFMPETQARVFDEGVAFSNAFVTTPPCCPSRASILTGMYAHDHGVLNNEEPLTHATMVHRLHDSGYFTGLVGKYLNSWDGSPRPEFDFWAGLLPLSTDPYFNADINVNGTWTRPPYYVTRVFEAHALDFLGEAAERDEPFFLLFAPNAPHGPAIPAPGDAELYSDLPPYRPPNYNEADVSDKPVWLRSRPPLTDAQQHALDNARDALRLKRLRTLKSVDVAVASMLDRLEEQGELDNTIVIYMSDNGQFWGEHNLDGKELVYEEAIRVPLGIRYPKAFPEGRVENALVGNIDIAPTIYELAGLTPPSEVDGRSLLSLMKGKGSWRDELVIEGWPAAVTYTALRTERYIYVENAGDLSELYDLREDPYQMENLAGKTDAAEILSDMKERLTRLVGTATPPPRE